MSEQLPSPIGRPPVHAPESYDAILERMEDGEFLREIEREPGVPRAYTVRRRAKADPEFGARYARARELQAHAHAERAVIAARTATPDNAQAARLQFDAERWIAGKLSPKDYAEKTLHTGGDGEGPIQFAVALNYDNLTDDEMITLRRLLEKASRPAIEGEVVDHER